MANVSYHTVFELSCFSEMGRLRPVLFVPFSLVYFLSVGANFLLVFVIVSRRNLHSPMCFLIAGMACVDGALPLFFLTQILLSLLFGWTQISLNGCLLQIFGAHLLGTFQSTFLLWMALDRYFAIVTPLRYRERMSLRFFLWFVVPLVLRNVLLISGLVVLAGRLRFCDSVVLNCFCEHMALVRLACGDTSLNSALGLLTISLVPVLDFVLITMSYIVILVSALSGRAVSKATHTVVTHVIVMMISLSVIMVAFISYRVSNKLPVAVRLLFSALYLFLPSLTNPIAFGIRTQEIRAQILNTLKTLRKC